MTDEERSRLATLGTALARHPAQAAVKARRFGRYLGCPERDGW